MIAVQTAIGGAGSKATTELSWSFDSMVSVGGFQYGLNDNGIHLLNQGGQDNSVDFTRTFTLATTDLGVDNPKRARFIHIGFEADEAFTLSVTFDNQTTRLYTVTPRKTGLQRIKVPISKQDQGRYVAIKISSINPFRVDSIEADFTIRSSGIRGY